MKYAVSESAESLPQSLSRVHVRVGVPFVLWAVGVSAVKPHVATYVLEVKAKVSG